jgi:hypothetical protein
MPMHLFDDPLLFINRSRVEEPGINFKEYFLETMINRLVFHEKLVLSDMLLFLLLFILTTSGLFHEKSVPVEYFIRYWVLKNLLSSDDGLKPRPPVFKAKINDKRAYEHEDLEERFYISAV